MGEVKLVGGGPANVMQSNISPHPTILNNNNMSEIMSHSTL